MNVLISIVTTLVCGIGFAAISVSGNCRTAVFQNMRRLNGGISWNRMRREFAAFGSYVAGLAVPLVLSLPAGILVADYVHTRIMPLNQMAAAVGNLASGSREATSDLKNLQKEHARWMHQNTPATSEQIHSLQRSLWFGWPMLATSGVTLLFLFGWLAFGFSKATVREYVRGIRRRRDLYERLDMQALMLPQRAP